MQKVFLSNYELNEAIDIYLGKLKNIKGKVEEINTWEACDRITSSPVFAKMSSPFYNSSAVDGIATVSEKTYEASDRNHVVLEEGTDYIVVDTGDPIPKEYDCVIMVEDIINIEDGKAAIYKSAVPWQNIRPLGEDIVETQLIIPSKHRIRPVDIGAMLAGGVNTVKAFKKPLIGVIPTGTEIVEPGANLKVGDIIEFNSRMFAAQIEKWGGKAKRYDIVKDEYELIKAALKHAAEECDMVLINAGSSAGREDFTYDAVSELGNVYVHGIAIKPGKPVILGSINEKPVIGIPGYPVSAYFVMENVCKRVVGEFLGSVQRKTKVVKAVLSRRVMSSLKYLEFVRVKLGYVGDNLIATPLSRGAGATMSLVVADGVLEIPQNVEGYEVGTEVEIKLLKDEEDIKNILVCIGSHDPILDIANDLLHMRENGYVLSSTHVGSMGGIMALNRGETHIAPIHLLDMASGIYNIPFIKKYVKDKEISLIKGVKRIQGIMVPKGNPMNINSLEDIAEKKPSFINRQRGSGTRLFLDYNLNKLNIDPKEIRGYEREEFTHLGVAAAVADDSSACGLGIYSAAMLMGLDFIPLGNEEYDFAVPSEFLNLNIMKEFIKVLQSDEFKREMDRLGGYDYSDIGKIIKVCTV